MNDPARLCRFRHQADQIPCIHEGADTTQLRSSCPILHSRAIGACVAFSGQFSKRGTPRVTTPPLKENALGGVTCDDTSSSSPLALRRPLGCSPRPPDNGTD